MQIIVPDYYKEFSCIADHCRHSCCIGWEIDIDGGVWLATMPGKGNTARFSVPASTGAGRYHISNWGRGSVALSCARTACAR